MNSEYAVYIDDVNIEKLGLRMRKGHEHPLTGGTLDRFISIPGKHGVYDYGADLEALQITLPLTIREDRPINLQTKLSDLKRILLDGKGKTRTFKLSFGYEPDRYYLVRLTGSVPLERYFKGYGRFDLPLIAPDPRSYSTTKNDEVVWGSETITFESEVYTYGHSGDGAKTFTTPGSTFVTVSGANVKPIFRLKGYGTNVSVACGEKSLSLGSFITSNWLIDLNEYVVLKNGINALHLIKGNWIGMELTQGDNKIDVSGIGLHLDFSVEFNDRYY